MIHWSPVVRWGSVYGILRLDWNMLACCLAAVCGVIVKVHNTSREWTAQQENDYNVMPHFLSSLKNTQKKSIQQKDCSGEQIKNVLSE